MGASESKGFRIRLARQESYPPRTRSLALLCQGQSLSKDGSERFFSNRHCRVPETAENKTVLLSRSFISSEKAEKSKESAPAGSGLG